jgi:hypothetical protein
MESPHIVGLNQGHMEASVDIQSVLFFRAHAKMVVSNLTLSFLKGAVTST